MQRAHIHEAALEEQAHDCPTLPIAAHLHHEHTHGDMQAQTERRQNGRLGTLNVQGKEVDATNSEPGCTHGAHAVPGRPGERSHIAPGQGYLMRRGVGANDAVVAAGKSR